MLGVLLSFMFVTLRNASVIKLDALLDGTSIVPSKRDCDCLHHINLDLSAPHDQYIKEIDTTSSSYKMLKGSAIQSKR